MIIAINKNWFWLLKQDLYKWNKRRNTKKSENHLIAELLPQMMEFLDIQKRKIQLWNGLGGHHYGCTTETDSGISILFGG